MKYILFLFVLFGTAASAYLLSAGMLFAADNPGTDKPNVLFIMVDEMRADALGIATENSPYKTPALDNLAKEGTLFSQAYTVAAVCVSSRYCFFTSRYSHVHGATNNNQRICEPQILLPSVMKHLGYETAISGKLHFHPNNADYDFDYFWSFGNEGTHKLQTYPEYLSQKYKPAERQVKDKPFPDDALGGDLGKLTYPKEDTQSSWITDRALEFFDKRSKDKPFFLFVSYLEPHSPSHLAEPYWSQYEEKKKNVQISPTFVPGKLSDTEKNPVSKKRHWVSDTEVAKAMTAAYHLKVEAVDDNIERLLAGLRKAGLDKDTLIIFTSDHGNMLGDHNRWFKGVPYEGSAKIPLIIKVPENSPYAAKFNGGKVVPQLVESIDVFPTILNVIGKPLPKDTGWQGTSLTQLVSNPAQWKNEIYSERTGIFIRSGKYKLIRLDYEAGGISTQRNLPAADSDEGVYELYDIESDPQETKNLIGDASLKTLIEELKRKLAAWQKDVPAVPKYPAAQT